MNKVFLRALAKEASTLHLKLLSLDEEFENKMVNLAFEQEVDAAKQVKNLKKYLGTLSELRGQIDDEMHNVDTAFEKQFNPVGNTAINDAFASLIESNSSKPDINAAFQDIINTFDDPIQTEDQNIINAAASFIHEMDLVDENVTELNEVEVLGKKLDIIQKQLGNWMSVGWGQAGLTYGSGEVRLENLDDVDKDSVKTDGYVLQYQASTDSWIGGTGGNPVVSGTTSGDTMTLVMEDGTSVDIGIEHAEVYLLLEDGDRILMEDSGYLVQNQLVGNPLVSGTALGDTLTLTQLDGSEIDIDITTVGDIIILLEDGFKIVLEDDSGFVMGNTSNVAVTSGKAIGNILTLIHQDGSEVDIDVNTIRWDYVCFEDNTLVLLENEWGFLKIDQAGNEDKVEWLHDIDRDTAMVDGQFLKYDSSSSKWVGAVSTTGGFDPSGYHYVNDSQLKYIENETENGGLLVPDNTWTKITCNGFHQQKLPTGKHEGIAGTAAWPGSGSTTYSRIWDEEVSRFFFDELPIETVVLFRVKVDSIPETNNTLLACRINFVAIRDGNDDPVLEDATIVSEYYITLEDGTGDDIVDEDNSGGKFQLEIGTDMGQGDYPGSYDGSNYKIELETATDGGSGILVGDFFQQTNFQQTVSAQELSDGAGEEQERTFVFPIYVGDSNSQRGYGEFEVFSSSEIVVNDTSILAALI